MEMRILCELGHWLLSEAELKIRWGTQAWHAAFEACGSPREWAVFTAQFPKDQVLHDLREQYEKIAKEVHRNPVQRVRIPVELPDF